MVLDDEHAPNKRLLLDLLSKHKPGDVFKKNYLRHRPGRPWPRFRSTLSFPRDPCRADSDAKEDETLSPRHNSRGKELEGLDRLQERRIKLDLIYDDGGETELCGGDEGKKVSCSRGYDS